jgi:hypothetical protein
VEEQVPRISDEWIIQMKKFIALYLAPISALEQMKKATPEQMKAGMDAWMKWAKKNEKSIVDLGAPLGKTKRITAAGIGDTRNGITGYSLVHGDSLDSVGAIFEGHPHLQMQGAWIEVLECMPIPGM